MAYFTDQMGEEFRKALADALNEIEAEGKNQKVRISEEEEVRKGRKKRKTDSKAGRKSLRK